MFDKMQQAIDMAQKAYDKGEVPVGAVIYKGEELIASAHNECCATKAATAHAEMLAIQKALKKLGTPYLQGCELYVTVEPCMMCMGAILTARLSRLVYGTIEPQSGFAETNVQIQTLVNTKNIEIYSGIKEKECIELMQRFFVRVRNKNEQLST